MGGFLYATPYCQTNKYITMSNKMNLQSLSHKQVSIFFLKWVQSSGFLKISDKFGGGWFKQDNAKTYSEDELFTYFESELEKELTDAQLTEYHKQLEEELKRVNSILYE